MSMLDAAIAIPTFRRLTGLRRLLLSLEPSARSHRVRFVIADNACDPVVHDLVAQLERDWPFSSFTYLPVSDRGISHNRNALLREFRSLADGTPWLGMLDDDLTAPADWLARMLEVGVACDADVVAAPYGMTEPPDNLFISESVLCKRQRHASGPIKVVHSGGNVLMSRRLLERNPHLWFDPKFGLSGGEDFDFFAAAQAAQARFAWCDEAFCSEEVSPDRLNARYVLYRYFTSGASTVASERKRRPFASLAAEHSFNLLKSAAQMFVGGVTVQRMRAVKGTFSAAYSVGALSGLLAGVNLERYR